MSYKEFEQEIIRKVSDKLGDSYVVTAKPINKNNGVVLNGLIINDGIVNISPTIYLEYYYEKYKGGTSISDIVNQIIEQFHRFELEDDFDISVFIDYEKCKHNISYKLINYEKNKKLLEEVPHIVYLDLAIVFYCLLDSDEFETSSILIRNSHIEKWGVNVDDLYEVATNNTPILLKSEIKDLSEIVKGILGDDADPELIEEVSTNNSIYVLTNKLRLYGACCILYKNVLEEFANKIGSDLYIIPSSIHEVLLMPSSYGEDTEYLSSLVKEVNAADLSEEDILSDHIYYYSRKDDAISY